eukprot:TRINITY_DN35582_c0_g1_i1.p1 TRINITY_DN35582_c0_g1~~TRINITY_DN35582_c0_g1_i1.p1  ORF type:complete len:471 (+),score=105.47 TRINITY_DN35582_c0_g1_i1:126-1538(+)
MVHGTPGDEWLEALRGRPAWTVEDNFQGVQGASLFSHSKYFACFLVLSNVCHFNYDTSLHSTKSGSWYSQDGAGPADLARLLESGNTRLCRDVGGKGSGRPSIQELQLRHGHFISRTELDSIIATEEEAAALTPDQKWDGSSVEQFKRGIIGNHDNMPGHFLHDVAMLADFQYAVWTSLGRKGTEPIWNHVNYYYPGVAQERLRKSPTRVLQLFFGNATTPIPGKKRPKYNHVCFKEAIFPFTNGEYQEPNESLNHFKKMAYAMLPESPVGPNEPLVYQITWLWRSSKRVIANPGELMEYLLKYFFNFPNKGELLPLQIVEFHDNMALEEIIDIMRHTALAFGVHGGAMFQSMFMPMGSKLVEILPYKTSEHLSFQRSGRSLGVDHRVWVDKNPENTVYDTNCFKSEWHSWDSHQCLKDLACLHCTMEHSKSTVAMPELKEVLDELKEGLGEWILKKREEEAASLEIPSI